MKPLTSLFDFSVDEEASVDYVMLMHFRIGEGLYTHFFFRAELYVRVYGNAVLEGRYYGGLGQSGNYAYINNSQAGINLYVKKVKVKGTERSYDVYYYVRRPSYSYLRVACNTWWDRYGDITLLHAPVVSTEVPEGLTEITINTL